MSTRARTQDLQFNHRLQSSVSVRVVLNARAPRTGPPAAVTTVPANAQRILPLEVGEFFVLPVQFSDEPDGLLADLESLLDLVFRNFDLLSQSQLRIGFRLRLWFRMVLLAAAGLVVRLGASLGGAWCGVDVAAFSTARVVPLCVVCIQGVGSVLAAWQLSCFTNGEALAPRCRSYFRRSLVGLK